MIRHILSLFSPALNLQNYCITCSSCYFCIFSGVSMRMTWSDYGPGCKRNNGFIEGPVLKYPLQANETCLCGVRMTL